MKLFLIASLVLALGAVIPAQERAPREPFKIAIHAEKPIVSAGSPVLISLQLTNASKREINPGWIRDVGGVIDTIDEFDVRDSQGRLIPKKTRNPNLPLVGSATSLATTKPGATSECIQDLARWFDLSRPGKYVVQASRPINGDKKEGTVKSNKITITVTQ